MLLSIGVICKYVSGRLPDHQSSRVSTPHEEREGPSTPVSTVHLRNTLCKPLSRTLSRSFASPAPVADSAQPQQTRSCGQQALLADQQDHVDARQSVEAIFRPLLRLIQPRRKMSGKDTLRLNRKCHLAATAVTRRGIISNSSHQRCIPLPLRWLQDGHCFYARAARQQVVQPPRRPPRAKASCAWPPS